MSISPYFNYIRNMNMIEFEELLNSPISQDPIRLHHVYEELDDVPDDLWVDHMIASVNRRYPEKKQISIRPLDIKNLKIKWYGMHYRAMKKGFMICGKTDFLDWFMNSPNECFYCNGAMKNKGLGRRLSIDRMDNTKGYTFDNMVKACGYCNSKKGSLYTAEQMKTIMSDVL
jgi:hypothetical protein